MSYYYNPYQNQNSYINNTQLPSYQSMYQIPQQMQQQIPVNQIQPQIQQQLLNGQMVDSIEAVKAKDVDLSGNPVFYPNVNGQEIYKKQLMSDGTSKIVIYKIITEEVKEKENTKEEMTNFINSLNDMKTEIIDEIRNIFG